MNVVNPPNRSDSFVMSAEGVLIVRIYIQRSSMCDGKSSFGRKIGPFLKRTNVSEIHKPFHFNIRHAAAFFVPFQETLFIAQVVGNSIQFQDT